MIDTPRTDQLEQVIPAPDGDDQNIVSAGFARQLEKELATVTKERDALRKQLGDLSDEMEEQLLK